MALHRGSVQKFLVDAATERTKQKSEFITAVGIMTPVL
jgi:hypothetical protein